jgi:hypothetical protein
VTDAIIDRRHRFQSEQLTPDGENVIVSMATKYSAAALHSARRVPLRLLPKDWRTEPRTDPHHQDTAPRGMIKGCKLSISCDFTV